MRPSDVPPGPLLVDTDVVSFIHAQRGPRAGPTVGEFEALITGHLLVVSFVTYAEALASGYAARLGQRRMNALHATLSRYVVLPSSAAAADHWAQIYPKVRGHVHGDAANDVWTAAVALGQDPPLPIVTNNLGDFQAIALHVPAQALKLIHPAL